MEFSLSLFCSCSGFGFAQQQLNNDSVIKMAKAGLADDLIVSTINASPGTYDASADGLIALKQARVGDKVIGAIVTKSTPPAVATPSAQTQAVPTQAATPPNPSTQLALAGAGAQALQAPQSSPPPPFHSTDGKVRIYVTDHPIFESNDIARAGGNRNAWGAAATSHTQAGDDPRTVEVEADIQKVCPPNVIGSNNSDRADYVLVFRRRGGERGSFFAFGGLTGLALSAVAKVDGAALFQNDGDMVYATKENTVEKSIKDVCTHLPSSAN